MFIRYKCIVIEIFETNEPKSEQKKSIETGNRSKMHDQENNQPLRACSGKNELEQ